MAFFYPIHHIGFVYPQYLSYPTATDSAVVHFDRQLSGFFRVCMPFRVYGIIFAALLTLAALAPRGVIPCLDLLLYPSAFRASFPCLFCSVPHLSYSIIKSLFWTLPGVSPPGARYFSHAGKVPKSALRGPALADFSPACGGTQSLCASPLRTPGYGAASVDWCSSDPGTSDAAAVALA